MSFGFGIGDIVAVAKLANGVRQKWSDAPGEYAAARNEIKTLESLLRDIADLDESIIPVNQKATLEDVVGQCQNALTAANKIVDTYSTSSTNRVRKIWTRFKADPDDVRYMRSQLVSIVAQLNAIQNNIQIELDRGLHEDIQVIKIDQQEERKLKIASWFSSVRFAQQQTEALNVRQPGTSGWILQHPIYQAWRDGSNQILFCPGIAGSGKTVIFATVVDDLQTYFGQDSTTVVAYFYCNYKRKDLQTLPLMLSTLVRQLFQEQRSIPQQIEEIYKKHKNRGSKPSVEELFSLVESLTRMYSKVLILIDALDECNNDDSHRTRDKILSYLNRLTQKSDSNLSIMTTCRPGVVADFNNSPQIEIRAQPEDIIRYLSSNVALIVTCTRSRPDLQTKVTQEIADIVDGMFLLARLHLESLHDQTKPRAVLKALQNLPRGSESVALNQAYSGVLDRIHQQREGLRMLAQKTLTWLICAKRELTMRELQEALAIEPDMEDIDFENDLDNEDTITSVCAGLVIIDPENGLVKLTHYTAQVYLEKNLNRLLPNGRAYVAGSCIAYLAMQTFYAKGMKWGTYLHTQLTKYKLLYYIGQNWGFHLRELDEILGDFSAVLANVDFQCLAAQLAFGEWDRNGYICYKGNIPFVYLLTYFDDGRAFQFLIERAFDVMALDNSQRSALHVAAVHGSISAASVLLGQSQIDPNQQDANGVTPLHEAARNGNEDIVSQLLVQCGVDLKVNLNDYGGQTPLMKAAKFRHVGIVARLLARDDIDLNSDYRNGGTPLYAAATEGHDKVVSQLLARHDIGPSLKIGLYASHSPLHTAVRWGHVKVVIQLLAGHDISRHVNLHDQYRETPLFLAVEGGHTEIAAQLLAREDIGPSVNLRTTYLATPLSVAISKDNVNVVEQLLARNDIGPSVNLQDRDGKTPLLVAISYRSDSVVRQLLAREDIGPSMNVSDNYKDTPISKAVKRGYEFAVALLVARKDMIPSLTMQDDDGETICSKAARGDYTESINDLLVQYNDASTVAEPVNTSVDNQIEIVATGN